MKIDFMTEVARRSQSYTPEASKKYAEAARKSLIDTRGLGIPISQNSGWVNSVVSTTGGLDQPYSSIRETYHQQFLLFGTKNQGTAALIGPDIIITARHNVNGEDISNLGIKDVSGKIYSGLQLVEDGAEFGEDYAIFKVSNHEFNSREVSSHAEYEYNRMTPPTTVFLMGFDTLGQLKYCIDKPDRGGYGTVIETTNFNTTKTMSGSLLRDASGKFYGIHIKKSQQGMFDGNSTEIIFDTIMAQHPESTLKTILEGHYSAPEIVEFNGVFEDFTTTESLFYEDDEGKLKGKESTSINYGKKVFEGAIEMGLDPDSLTSRNPHSKKNGSAGKGHEKADADAAKAAKEPVQKEIYKKNGVANANIGQYLKGTQKEDKAKDIRTIKNDNAEMKENSKEEKEGDLYQRHIFSLMTSADKERLGALGNTLPEKAELSRKEKKAILKKDWPTSWQADFLSELND
jgi:hypothetical protein